jgi:hypothetical protein
VVGEKIRCSNDHLRILRTSSVHSRPLQGISAKLILRKLFAFLGLLGVIYALALQHGVFDHAAALTPPGVAAGADSARSQNSPTAADSGSTQECNEAALASAYRNRQSRVEVCGHGVIAKVLRDDTQGIRHQRFVVRLPPGQTVLIAYNFDLAPRIDGLRTGSPIEFVGEYEWNGQGGVVHWTHRDPGGHHSPGWIRYEGRQYQ